MKIVVEVDAKTVKKGITNGYKIHNMETRGFSSVFS